MAQLEHLEISVG